MRVRVGVTAAVALVAAWLIVAFARVGADWPAQDYRAFLAEDGGVFAVWTNNWYSGVPLPGYSVLYPLLAGPLGSSVVGVLAVTVAAACAAALAPAHRVWGPAFCAGVAFCLLENLLIGQVTFLLGTAFAGGALLALRADRRGWTAVAALAASLSSPLVAAFLLLAGAALWRSLGWRRVVPLSAAFGGAAVAAVVDAGGGPFPYHPITLVAITLFCAAVLVLASRREPAERAWRDFAVLYVLVAAAAFVIDNPVGANLNRLGKFAALPLVLFYLGTRAPGPWRRRGLAVALVAATWWSLLPVVSAVQWGAPNPGRHASYFAGLLRFLDTQDPAGGRLEIPFTRSHDETYRVAREFPLARGWERQVDLADNDVLYSRLSADSYRRWLDRNGVSLVALSTLTPDVGGEAERDLLRDPPGYLRPVWRDAHWRVWRVADATPIATGAARLTRLGTSDLTLRFTRAGKATVRVRSSPMWTVASGDATLTRTDDGRMQVTTRRVGEVRLEARLTFALLDPTNGLR